MSAMLEQYGPEKAKRVFYASRNAGKITGVDPESSRAAGGPVCPTCGGSHGEGEPHDAHEHREAQLISELASMQRHHAHMSKMRAAGGHAGAGSYMVGERGPELFVPDRPGTIIPHHELTRLARKYGGGRVSSMRAGGGRADPYEAAGKGMKEELQQMITGAGGAPSGYQMLENVRTGKVNPLKMQQFLGRAHGGRVSKMRRR